MTKKIKVEIDPKSIEYSKEYEESEKTEVDYGESTDKSIDYFIFEGDKYYKLNSVYHKNGVLLLPRVTGLRKFKCYESVNNFKIPFDCKYVSILNTQKEKQEQQIQVLGSFGSAKSVFILRMVNILMAKGYHPFTFFDIFNEVRHHIPYGFVDENNQFIPFKIRYLIPEGYSFESVDIPYWNERKNVTLEYFSSIKDIVDFILADKYTINAIYQECFDEGDLLIIFLLIYEYLRKSKIDKEKGYDPILFFHHEISQLFPQEQSKETWWLSNYCAKRFVEFRKCGILSLVAMQLPQELFYRIGFKFTVTVNCRQNPNAVIFPPQKVTLGYKTGECNIEKEGFYMKHYFEDIPQVESAKIIPSFEQVNLIDFLPRNEFNIIVNFMKSKLTPKQAVREYRDFLINRFRKTYPEVSHSDICYLFNIPDSTLRKIIEFSNKEASSCE